jgi:predicted AlkP superfamily pyrophosphatase or phosphodiesterase
VRRTVVLDVVGLSPAHLGPHTPNLSRLADRGQARPLSTITPAVTCSVQSTFVTGALPSVHGCVANGWYFRELAQPWLWRQSNALVQGDKLWDLARARDSGFTVAKLFWWYNMYAKVDWAITPRPIYRADGRKLPDIHTSPTTLRNVLQSELGRFPLFDFWGPRAGIPSSRWIGRAAQRVMQMHDPVLTLVYLPHLDYDLQRFGPEGPHLARALAEIDEVCGELLEVAERREARVIVLSEYGITRVSGPVHINRALRQAGMITWREEEGEEHLDPGLSTAFAVADHQIAHVYVNDPDRVGDVKAILEALPGVERVLDDAGKKELGLDHPRAGELVAIADATHWFTYYWWHDDRRAPDYARCVDIHSKPGYDPCELFIDPEIPLAPVLLGSKLFRSKVLNQRTLMDVITLDASIVKGSHGRPTDDPQAGPVILAGPGVALPGRATKATDVRDLVLATVFDDA